MAIDTSVPRTRRALLAGGVGGLVALVTAAIGRPLAVRAADGEVVQVGGSYTGTKTTAFDTGSSGETALWGQSVTGQGVRGQSDSDFGVFGESASQCGVKGESTSGTGVMGESASQKGVYGYSAANVGVHGASPSNTGVLGTCDSGWGVHGASGTSYGVVGTSHSSGSAGTVGNSQDNGLGLLGFSGGSGSTFASSHPKTGVYGRATQDANARGVHGYSTAGRGIYGEATTGYGVRGQATSGTAGYFATTSAKQGYALRAVGRVKLDKASGVATITASTNSVVITPGLDVTSTSFILLTPKADLGTRRLWYTTNTTDNTITIKVSAAVTADLRIGWLLLG